MRVAISILATLSIAFAATTGRAGAGALTDDAQRSRPSVVIVSAHLGFHRDAIGAGVVVATLPAALRILTARHVTQTGDVTIWIEGIGYPAEVVRTFAHRDLAVVDVLVPSAVRAHVLPAVIAPSIASDDAIVVWGEDDAGPRLERGRVLATRFIAPEDALTPPLLDIECARCTRGDSGGGVFSSSGELIGILVARYYGSEHRTVATVAEIVDASLVLSLDDRVQATTAVPSTSTVRSQNDPKLSPD